jgi:hypothetical protein
VEETEQELEKAEWIALYGSVHLKLAFFGGYFCDELYVKERAKIEYPGFALTPLSDFQREVGCPPLYALKAAQKFPEAKI